MKFRSLTSRLILTVICIEAMLAACITLVAIDYQRRESIRAFDVMLHGRADSVLGAVQDAEDPADNVMLDKTSISVPSEDVYEVGEENGHFIGSSDAVRGTVSSQLHATEDRDGPLRDDGEAHRIRLGEKRYRAIVQHRVRLIDPDEPGTGVNGKGTLHHLVIYYASPSKPVHDAFWHSVRFFALTDTLALLLSIAIVTPLIRRGLRPLDALAAQAALVSPRAWTFKAPPAAYELHELAPLASALDTALKGLERAFQQQRTFVNDAAHELKTALTLLKSSLQLLTLRDRTKIEYQNGIESCLADCGRMEELVQRMLLLARVEQKLPNTQFAKAGQVYLPDVIRQTSTQLESAAALRRVSLQIEILDEPSISLAEEDCAILFTNLLMNAIQHSSADSTVVVQLLPLNNLQTQLAVIDQGEGISPDHLPLVFERFYRTDASRSRDTGGTGLGLAICKAIVESKGGTIEIQSELTRGTTVRVILPAHRIGKAPSRETLSEYPAVPAARRP